MGEYGFFVAHLRFIAAKTDTSEPEIAMMVAELGRIADAVEACREITVPFERLRIAARGLAGVAGFLQEQILLTQQALVVAQSEQELRQLQGKAAFLGTLLQLQDRVRAESKRDEQ